MDRQWTTYEAQQAMVIEVLRSEQLSRVPIDLFVFGSESSNSNDKRNKVKRKMTLSLDCCIGLFRAKVI